MSIEMKLNGRTIRPGDLGRHLQSEVERVAQEALKARVSALRCPIHGQRPVLKAGSRTGSQLSMTIEACCDEMLARAQQELRG